MRGHRDLGEGAWRGFKGAVDQSRRRSVFTVVPSICVDSLQRGRRSESTEISSLFWLRARRTSRFKGAVDQSRRRSALRRRASRRTARRFKGAVDQSRRRSPSHPSNRWRRSVASKGPSIRVDGDFDRAPQDARSRSRFKGAVDQSRRRCDNLPPPEVPRRPASKGPSIRVDGDIWWWRSALADRHRFKGAVDQSRRRSRWHRPE